jgi:hypothetical protein
MQQGVEKWVERAASEAKTRHGETKKSRTRMMEAKDCFVWKGMEEDGVA